jgi:hypothetical protein
LRIAIVRLRPRVRVAAVCSVPLLAAVLALIAAGASPLGSAQPAAGQAVAPEPVAQTDDSVPATNVTMIGSSPQEADGETWGVGEEQGGSGGSPAVLVRYTSESGWQLGPGLENAEGEPLADFNLDKPSGLTGPSPLAGSITSGGSGVLVGTVPGATGVECGSKVTEQAVLVRDPGGAFKATSAVPGEDLGAGECLFGIGRAPLVAALEETPGHAGALLVPADEGGTVEDGVLHWNGSAWKREPILTRAQAQATSACSRSAPSRLRTPGSSPSSRAAAHTRWGQWRCSGGMWAKAGKPAGIRSRSFPAPATKKAIRSFSMASPSPCTARASLRRSSRSF